MDDFVGRAAELAVLADELERARSGRLRVVMVEGEPGAGKTTLVRRFLDGLGDGWDTGPRVLYASGDEAERSVPLGVVAQLAAGLADEAPPPLDQVARAGTDTADPMRVGGALVSLVGRWGAAGRLTVVVVDDVPWADIPSQQVLAFALRRLRADPVLCLCTVATGAAAVPSDSLRRLSAEAGRRLRLAGLPVEAIRALAPAVGVGPISARLAKRVHDLTGGNPLHARALIEELPAEVLASDGERLPAPRSFGLVVLGRLAGCPPQTQRLVVAAAVLGRSCPLADAARLGDVDDPLTALEPAVVAGLLTEVPDGAGMRVAFGHPLVRAAIYHDLGPARRGALHRQAALAVEDPMARLRHRIEATPLADEDLAADAAAEAAAQARAGRWAAAADLWLAATRLTADATGRDEYLTNAVMVGLYGGQIEAVTRAAAAAGPLADPARRHFVSGALALVHGDSPSGTAALRRAWAELEQTPRVPLARLVAESLVIALFRHGSYDAAATWAERAANADEGAALYPPYVLGYLMVAGNLHCGRVEPARVLVDAAAARLGPDQADGAAAGAVNLTRGILLLTLDRPIDALAELRLAAARLRRDQPTLGIGLSALFDLAVAEYHLGHWDDAVAHGALGASIALDSEQGWLAGPLLCWTVIPLAGRGAAEAATYLGQAETVFAASVDPAPELLVMARAWVAHAADDHAATAAALAWFAGLTAGSQDPIEPTALPWRPLYAGALARLGHPDEAHQVLVPWEEAATARGHLRAQLAGLRARAAILRAHGDRPGAVRAYQRAAKLAAGLPAPFECALLQYDYGTCLLAEGQTAEAVTALRAARELFAGLGAAPYLGRCEALLAGRDVPGADRPARPAAVTGGLTAQELNVARLAADGLSNNEIADQMVLSVRTIEFHLGNVYAKLGLRRTQLAVALQQRPPVG
ncbi:MULTISPECIES: helix-turn-helix transcriptional regulator [Pseudofrankia]|uniref:helix-turn-helix transcriptional regulator n=1 Tax=Pseudofrankia TaxID=2994363 RepID=UPI0008D9E82D|nr:MULTISPECIES: LuxR family transcriptional regulator [Pseudofrankia]